MFDDLLKQSASVMEAYRKMKEAEEKKKQETCTEGDDTGGDGSAYNKYLLGKTGDLPRSKKAYMKVDEAEDKKDPCWDGYEMVGMKKKDGKTVPNCVPVEEEKWIDVDPKKRGMFKDWTLADLESEVAALKKKHEKSEHPVSEKDKTYMAELEFAIRAKRGHGFSK